MRFLLIVIPMLVAAPAFSEEPDVQGIVDRHVLPGYENLAAEAAVLASSAQNDCSPDGADLVSAYHNAFDAWISVSHLRFGPSEQDDRAFALAFWPDPRGSTPKTLATLFRDQDPAISDPAEFADFSVATRGFYALEFLLFDPQFTENEAADYHCALVRAVTTDISGNAAAILDDWQNGYADLMSTPGNDTYRTSTEAAQQLFTALSTGLEFTSGTRLARPLGTFERPRPNRAEARRSERSLRNVMVALTATQDLAKMISMGNEDVSDAFKEAIKRGEELDDPVFAGVAEPLGRLRVEALQQRVDVIRRKLTEDVGPSLGIAAGFNSLDGD